MFFIFRLILDYGFAWISVLLTALLAVKYISRKLAAKQWSGKPFFTKLNKKLGKTHIYCGISLLVTGLVHGLSSSVSVLSINVGTLCFIIAILLGLTYMFRKKFKKRWMPLHRILTVLMIAVLVWHVVDVGGIQVLNVLFPQEQVIYEAEDISSASGTVSSSVQSSGSAAVSSGSAQSSGPAAVSSGSAQSSSSAAASSGSAQSSSSAAPSSGSAQSSGDTSSSASWQSSQSLSDYNNSFGTNVVLKDGTYTGAAQAYGPNLTVSVTVSGNRVTNIKVVSHNERNSSIYGRAFNTVPQEIVSNQSLDVDTVTGATFSSVGIINAVNNALQQALVSGTLPALKSLPRGR